MATESEGSLGLILQHALALKDHPEAVESCFSQVRKLVNSNQQLFSPISFPIIEDNIFHTTVVTTREYHDQGRYLAAEAVAVNILLKECGLLTEGYRKLRLAGDGGMKDVITLPYGMSTKDAIEGFAEFGNYLRRAASAREYFLIEQTNTNIETDNSELQKMVKRIREGEWKVFGQAIMQDEMVIDKNTVDEILAKMKLPESIDNPDYEEQVVRRFHGAERAALLYTEALSLAVDQGFSLSIDLDILK